MNKKIAVIGAGLTGIGCLVELRRAGHAVRLYEQNDDIGGVWHPSNCYSGLSIHAPAVTFEYHDFPLPSLLDKSKRITSGQVFLYLKSYFTHHGLYRFSEFNSKVDRISYSTRSGKTRLGLRRADGTVASEEFDYVVHTHGFAARNVPRIDNSKAFNGRILHSFDVNDQCIDEIVRANSRVVLVGGSKTATDLILRFHQHAYHVHWLYRRNYWFIRSDPLINVIADRLAGKRGNLFHRAMFLLGDLLGARRPALHLALWRASGLLHTFGPKHWDFRKYHRGRIDSAAMSVLRKYDQAHGMTGEIQSFAPGGLILTDGRFVECDTVIFCTGSSPHGSLPDVDIDGVPVALPSVRAMYRARVIPQLPGLIFTAMHLLSFGVVNGLMSGRWVARYVESGLTAGELEREATRFDRAFFSSGSYLFDSSGHFNVTAGAMLAPFFRSGELSKREYVKWLWRSSSATAGVPPLDFRAPSARAAPVVAGAASLRRRAPPSRSAGSEASR